VCPTNKIGSRDWANSQLRFVIAVLQDRVFRATWKGKLQMALIVRDRLLEYGFTWQAARVDNWIHRLQPRRADLSEREEGGLP
jgi:hypothetical protein